MKKILSALLGAAVLFSFTLTACSSDSEESSADSAAESSEESVADDEEPSGELDKVTIQLKWLPQAQFMGYYVAEEKGYYEEEGIDIEILPGGSDIIPEQQVYGGSADIGVTWVSSLMKYQESGWELTQVAQIFQKSAMLLVSKAETGIESAEDLAGKKVGSWFGGNEYELFALIESVGLDRENDLEMVQQDYTMNQLIGDEIDAASAMTYNEYGLLLAEGYTEDDLNALNMNDEGVAMLEDCLFVSDEWVAENEDLLVRFLRASIKGWADASADPEAAGTIVSEVGESVSLDHQIYMAEEVAKLVVPEGFDPANIGYIDMDSLEQTAEFALRYGLLESKADLSTAVDTSYWEQATE